MSAIGVRRTSSELREMPAYDPSADIHSFSAWLQSNTGRKSAEYVRAPTDCHFLTIIIVAWGILQVSGAVMKKLATARAAIALVGTPAFAADMAVKAPPPAAHSGAQLSSWEFRVTAALRP